ncbi:MAG: hypothetical protein Q4B40_05160 [Clostridia bacterium]|nr:hypothetical protein [Clostridia bacterium]
MNNNFKIDKDAISAAKRGDKNALLANLTEAEKQQLQATLNDKEKLQSILNSDAARRLMKILGETKNG